MGGASNIVTFSNITPADRCVRIVSGAGLVLLLNTVLPTQLLIDVGNIGSSKQHNCLWQVRQHLACALPVAAVSQQPLAILSVKRHSGAG